MGLISGLKAFGQRTVTSQNILGKGLDVVSGVFSHPITAVTKGVKEAVKTFEQESKTQRAISTLTATAGYVSAVAGAGALTGKAVAGTLGGTVTQAVKTAVAGTGKAVGKSFIAHPISTTAGALLGAPLVAGVIKKKPELITSLPSKSFETGQKLVDVIEEHPVTSALLGGTVGGVALYEGYKYLTGGDGAPTTPTQTTPSLVTQPTPQSPVSAKTPLTPETKEVKSTTIKRRKRKAKKAVPMNNINIRIDDRDVYAVNGRKVYKGGQSK